jgi:AbrB family looped-hinge helix DNA binding protein
MLLSITAASLFVMRVTSKGQVTIPQKVRELLGITPGSEVDFEVDGRGARLIRMSPGDGRAIATGMRGRATVPMSTEEILALTRGDE